MLGSDVCRRRRRCVRRDRGRCCASGGRRRGRARFAARGAGRREGERGSRVGACVSVSRIADGFGGGWGVGGAVWKYEKMKTKPTRLAAAFGAGVGFVLSFFVSCDSRAGAEALLVRSIQTRLRPAGRHQRTWKSASRWMGTHEYSWDCSYSKLGGLCGSVRVKSAYTHRRARRRYNRSRWPTP